MRILFTILPATSHLLPLAPLAWALQSAGHEVRVATHRHPVMPKTITSTGLTAVMLGEEVNLAAGVDAARVDVRLAYIADAMGIDPSDTNLWEMVRYYVLSTFASYFPVEAPVPEQRPMLDELVAFTAGWQPDLVLWDPLFFPAPIAARTSGAAHARLLWGLDRIGWIRSRFVERMQQPDAEPIPDLMAEMMEPTLRRFGVDFGEDLLLGQWSVDPMPPQLRLPVNLDYVSMRSVPYTGSAVLPDWLRDEPKRPRVVLTLGTSGRELFSGHEVPLATLLEVVADLDIEVVATVNAKQLAAIDTVPDNVRTFDYVPLNLLLPTCSAIIHLGGTGTFSAAVAHRVPQLVIPKNGSEYVDFANFAADRGAGLVADWEHSTVEQIRAQLVRVLEEPSFREGAAALSDAMAARPSPTEIVPLLERLTVEHRA